MFQQYKEIYQYKELLYNLILRQLKVRYKQTLLGIGWALFTPIVMMFIFTIVFSKITKIETGDIPYSIFVYCGLLPWLFFANSLTSATTSLIDNIQLLTKIYFPREIFPLSVIAAKFVDLFISSLLLVGLMLFYKINFCSIILFVPLIFIIQIIFMIGISYLLSMGNLFFRDVKYIFEVIIILWMFSTSVIYPINSPVLQKFLILNPMIAIIDSYRTVILLGKLPDMKNLSIACVISIIVFIVGSILFHRNEHLFAENI